MKQKIIRVGRHSLAVIIPAKFIHSLGIKAGDYALVKPHLEKGIVNIHFTGSLQLPLNLPSKRKK